MHADKIEVRVNINKRIFGEQKCIKINVNILVSKLFKRN